MDSNGLLEFLQHAQQARYVTVGALCLVLHDHFFTCRQEWKFIWIRKWSFSKVLFFLSRYGTLGVLLFDLYVALNGGSSDNFCTIWFCFQSWSGFCSTIIIEAVLIFRIYAMYHGEKNIMYFLGGLFACQVGAMAYILQAGCRALKAVAEPMPGVRVCMPVSTMPYEYAYWIALLIFELLLFVLSMRKAVEHVRQYAFHFDDLVLSRRVGEVLIRDGVMYFPFIFLSYCANLVLFALSPAHLAQVAPHAALALRSVLTNRLLLNVSRKFYYPNQGAGHAGPAHGNSRERDREGPQTQTGRDSILGFVVWASAVRRGPGASHVGLDGDGEGEGEGVGDGGARPGAGAGATPLVGGAWELRTVDEGEETVEGEDSDVGMHRGAAGNDDLESGSVGLAIGLGRLDVPSPDLALGTSRLSVVTVGSCGESAGGGGGREHDPLGAVGSAGVVAGVAL